MSKTKKTSILPNEDKYSQIRTTLKDKLNKFKMTSSIFQHNKNRMSENSRLGTSKILLFAKMFYRY